MRPRQRNLLLLDAFPLLLSQRQQILHTPNMRQQHRNRNVQNGCHVDHLLSLLSRKEREIISLHIISSSHDYSFSPEHPVVVSLSSFHASLPVPFRHCISLHPTLIYTLSLPQQLLATTLLHPPTKHSLHRKRHHRFRNLLTRDFVRPFR